MKELLLLQLKLEVRNHSILTSLFLYLVCLVLIIYLTIGNQPASQSPAIWSALFWMTLLFTTVNTIAKSFMPHKADSGPYMYSIASAEQIILSKIFYGFILNTIISLIGFVLFATLLKNPIEDLWLFLSTLLLASYGFSASLSLLSGIASKADNNSVVMAVLSFPVIIGLLLMVIKITRHASDGLEIAASYNEVITIAAINILVTAVSYLLFPYIWRS
ncbi:MAG: heme exporter protein CcmB [Bacteroidetes bacterium]|nr:heme exporter protein CcmB [Bacteroidota bacterium]